MTPPQSDRPLSAVIMAAGKGTRMGSDLPKVLHEVAGRPMLHWVVQACRDAGASPIILVVGHGAQDVHEAMAQHDDIIFVTQEPQLGTGHAVDVCREHLDDIGGDTFVLAGDGPLIRTSTLDALYTRHVQTEADATLATAFIEDPSGYGRIVRDDQDRFRAIVEHRDCSDEQLTIREIYPSYACFAVEPLLATLRTLKPSDDSGEYYLTHVPTMLRESGQRVEVISEVPTEDVLSINTPEQLAEVDAMLRERLATEAAT